MRMVNIFDKNMVNAGKIRPFTIATKIPIAKSSLESFAYEKSLEKIESSYFFNNSYCSFFYLSYLVKSKLSADLFYSYFLVGKFS